jgi:hypothetical protein
VKTLLSTICLGLLLVGVAPAADSLNVRLVGYCDIPAEAEHVVVRGGYAYVADAESGLLVVSVSDPAHPSVVGRCSTGFALDVGVAGDYAYVTAGHSGLRVISVSDPAHPIEVGHCDMPQYTWGVVVADSCAYIADGDAGLRVISVSDPSHPTELGYCLTPSGYDVAVVGDYAYVVGLFGLSVVSGSDRSHPVQVGQLDTSGFANGVAATVDTVYVAGMYGFYVISVSDPQHPAKIGFLNTINASDVSVIGECAYVAAKASGLRIISVADPEHPVEVGYYITPGYFATGVTVAGGYIYVADGGFGFEVYQFYGGGVDETPNAEVRTPNRGATVIRGVLFLPEASSHKPQAASLIDISGRKVLDLHPGANDVSRPAPGVYFVRSEPSAVSREPSAVTKVIITR